MTGYKKTALVSQERFIFYQVLKSTTRFSIVKVRAAYPTGLVTINITGLRCVGLGYR
jgi:hypothetical protein